VKGNPLKYALLPLLLVAVAVPALRSGATIASYPPRACGLQVSKTAVARGQTLVVSACGFHAFGRVHFGLRQSRTTRALGSAQADRRGRVRARLRIPLRSHIGRSLILASGLARSGRRVTLQAVIHVR
jgi:hypothetical protein